MPLEETDTIDHFVSSCRIVTQIEYKEMHDKIGHNINWKIHKYYWLLKSEKW